MRFSVFLAGMFGASSAQAHVGHLGEFAGHDHWVAGGAIGIAIGIAGWNLIKGKKGTDAEVDEGDQGEPDQDPQEA